MKDYTLGAVEQRFASLIWDNEPVSTRELVALAESALSWKKSTTYTILRRLSERGLFQNRDGVVTACLSREEFLAQNDQNGLQDNKTQTFTMNNGDDSWYFYNTATRNAGRTDFQKRWGSRKLENDWRRRNKSSFSFDDFGSGSDDDGTEDDNADDSAGD